MTQHKNDFYCLSFKLITPR